MTDLAIRPLYFDVDGEYGADDLRLPWGDAVFQGVVYPDDFLVVAKGGNATDPDAGGGSRNLSVDILTGRAWIQGTDAPNTQGYYRAYVAGTTNEGITANVSGSTRIDAVILEMIDAPTYKGRTRVVAGTPGAGTPTIPANSLCLATVSLASGGTAITGANITDTRTRAIRPSYYSTLSGDVSLSDTAWTSIMASSVVLERDCRVRVTADVRINVTGSSNSTVSAAILDGTAVFGRLPTYSLPGTASAGGNPTLRIRAEDDCAAGTHTFTLQGYKNGSTVSASGGTTTFSGYTDYQTKMWVELIG